MNREEIKKKIEELELELECLKNKLEESVVRLRLGNGKQMEIPEEKIVKLRSNDECFGGIRTLAGSPIAWVAYIVNEGRVIHLAPRYNYHLGSDPQYQTLVVTKKTPSKSR